MAVAVQLALMKNNMSNLKCSTCENYLSVAPIYTNKGKFICGRCKPLGDRVTIYEELAKYMTFPCVHKSCTLQLKWGQVQNHEQNCPFKIVACPKIKCATYHTVKDLNKHFKDMHQDLLYVSGKSINRRLRDMPVSQFNKDKKVYLLQHENQSYLIMVYCTYKEDRYNPGYIASYSYYFGAFYLYQNEYTKTKYDLTVSVADEDNVVTDYCWYGEPLRQFNYKEHCLGCLEPNCHLGHNGTPKIFLWNKIDKIKNDCDYVVTYSVKLVNQTSTKNIDKTFGNSSLASKLECPVCYEYLSAPIFICNTGHSLCSNCKKKLKKCALCQAVVSNSRNYALEEISESLEICCPNASQGCKYFGKIPNTKMHFSICVFNSN